MAKVVKISDNRPSLRGAEEYSIEHGVPVSGIKRPSSTRPFSLMSSGDSFVVSHEDRRRVLSAAYYYKRHHPGWGYTCLRQVDGTYRLWRLS